MKNALIKSGFFLTTTALISLGCSSVVETQEERSDNFYSIYGVLEISKPENFIRIHDNRIPLWESSSEKLDIEVILQDMSNQEEEALTDLVVPFDGMYTHNFSVLTPIKFDNVYQLKLADRNGFKDSILVKTPQPTTADVFIPQVRCDLINLEFTFDPVDYEAGEILDFRLEFEHLENTYGLTETYKPDFITDNGKVKLILGLEHSINKGLGTLWFGYQSCKDLKINEFILYYSHYGEELNPPEFTIEEGGGFFGKRILGVYSDSMHVVVSDSLYRDELWDL
ncbi:MAG: hypothetical protein RLN81_11160 [Balneolaceae bacterium]